MERISKPQKKKILFYFQWIQFEFLEDKYDLKMLLLVKRLINDYLPIMKILIQQINRQLI
jgi:hypothetical protein